MLIKGIRKVDRRNGKPTSKCQRVSVSVNRTSTRLYMDFSNGGQFAFNWLAVAELMSTVTDMGNLADAGISASQWQTLVDSIAHNSVIEQDDYQNDPA